MTPTDCLGKRRVTRTVDAGGHSSGQTPLRAWLHRHEVLTTQLASLQSGCNPCSDRSAILAFKARHAANGELSKTSGTTHCKHSTNPTRVDRTGVPNCSNPRPGTYCIDEAAPILDLPMTEYLSLRKCAQLDASGNRFAQIADLRMTEGVQTITSHFTRFGVTDLCLHKQQLVAKPC
jgi:hypothetical protein